jgi:hypothetical protein
MADVSGNVARMDDHRRDRRPASELTPGELLDEAIGQLAERAGVDLATGNWQVLAHVQNGRIRKAELLPVTSSVRITVGAREMFDPSDA